jgi:ribosome maturation factor RimP
MHRAIDPVLDVADPIECAYYLEVSSPGLERELRTDDHIYACEGWEVELRLFAPIEGSKVFCGILGETDESGNIVLEINGEQKRFPRAAVAKITTVFHFED